MVRSGSREGLGSHSRSKVWAGLGYNKAGGVGDSVLSTPDPPPLVIIKGYHISETFYFSVAGFFCTSLYGVVLILREVISSFLGETVLGQSNLCMYFT